MQTAVSVKMLFFHLYLLIKTLLLVKRDVTHCFCLHVVWMKSDEGMSTVYSVCEIFVQLCGTSHKCYISKPL